MPKTPERTSFSFAASIFQRALWDGLAERTFTAADHDVAIAFFGANECVYCGSTAVTRWDHLVALMVGGDTVIGNMVPACQPCDDSKRAEPFDTWMYSPVSKSPKSRGIPMDELERRIERIREYVKHHAYESRHREARLDDQERARLGDISRRLDELRADAEGLVARYRGRPKP